MPLTLKQRGKVWHYIGTVAGRRLRGSTGATDKKLAQRIAAEVEAKEWKRHLDGPGADVTFAQASIAYRKAEGDTRFLARLEDHWRDTRIRDITPGAIRSSALTLYPDAKGATRNRQVIVPTMAVINHAAELEWCTKISVRRFTVDTKPKVPVDKVWVERFVANASPHLGALCLFMYSTGARITEALNVTWADVDMHNRAAIINQTKVRDRRRAHLPGPVLAAIANIPGDRKADDRVFLYTRRDSVKDPWEAACQRAGIKLLTPHSCRHGFATDMLRAGVDVKTVAEMGGWKDATTVLRTYAHALDDPTVTDVLFGTNLTQPVAEQTVSTRKHGGKH